MNIAKNVIIVEDDETSAQVLKIIFRHLGCICHVFTDEYEVIEFLKETAHETYMLFTDFHLMDLKGLELCELAKELNPNMVTAIVSGDLRLAEIDFSHPKVDFFIPKPYSVEELKSLLEFVPEEVVQK